MSPRLTSTLQGLHGGDEAAISPLWEGPEAPCQLEPHICGVPIMPQQLMTHLYKPLLLLIWCLCAAVTSCSRSSYSPPYLQTERHVDCAQICFTALTAGAGGVWGGVLPCKSVMTSMIPG